MSKEFNLTNKGQNPYPEEGPQKEWGEDIFMASEPGKEEIRPASGGAGKEPPINPPTATGGEPLGEGPHQQVDLDQFFKGRGIDFLSLDEAGRREVLARHFEALSPDLTREAFRRLFEPPVYSTEESREAVEESTARSVEAGLGTEARNMVGAPPTETFQDIAERVASEMRDNPVFQSIALRAAAPGINIRALQALQNEIVAEYDILRARLENERNNMPPDATDLERRRWEGELANLLRQRERMGQLFGNLPDQQTGRHGLSEEDKAKLRGIEGMPDGPDRRKAIRAVFSEYAPEDDAMPDEVLRLIASDSLVAEEFITRLTVSDLEDEQWQMRGFYSSINYEKFLRISRGVMSPDEHQRILNLVEANRAFHDMNYIIKRNFERFGDSSEGLLSEHFQVLSRINGMEAVLQMYEEAYQMHLGGRTRISEQDFLEIDREVAGALGRLNDSGRIIGLTGGPLQDWEVHRVRIFARNFYRVIARTAEQSVYSELPDSTDPALFTSVAQRGLTQIMNNLKYTGVRFRPAEEFGGPEMLKNGLEENKRRRDPRMQLKTLQGTDVDMRESQQIVATRGVMATWRVAESMLKEIRFNDLDGRVTNIVQFFKDHREIIDGVSSLRRNRGESEADFNTRKKEAVRTVFQPLIDNTSVALGLLTSPCYMHVPAELKEIIWEKAAELNPQMMASLLARIELSEGATRDGRTRTISSLEDILLETWGDPEQRTALAGGQINQLKRDIERQGIELATLSAITNPNQRTRDRINTLRANLDRDRLSYSARETVLQGLFKNENWTNLLDKIRTAHYSRIQDEQARLSAVNPEGEFTRLGEAPRDLESYLIGDLSLSDNERVVFNAIIANGKEIAPDLARVRQSTAWFINDVPFSIQQWNSLGQFYDRQTGDLGNFNKASSALLTVISNPFGSTEETIKAFREAITSAGNVIGGIAAQNNMESLYVAWVDMMQEVPWKRQKIISALHHMLRAPTSRAQEIVGLHAPALDEDGTFHVLEESLKAGILRKEVKDPKTGKELWSDTHEKLIHRFKVGTWNRLVWAKFRDLGPFALLSMIIEFFKSVSSYK